MRQRHNSKRTFPPNFGIDLAPSRKRLLDFIQITTHLFLRVVLATDGANAAFPTTPPALQVLRPVTTQKSNLYVDLYGQSLVPSSAYVGRHPHHLNALLMNLGGNRVDFVLESNLPVLH